MGRAFFIFLLIFRFSVFPVYRRDCLPANKIDVQVLHCAFQVAGALSALLEILDIASLSDGFEIIGGFQSSWRAHVWEGKNRAGIFLFVFTCTGMS